MGALFSDLDDGSGCCKYFDKKTNLCSIYEKRPIQCRITEGYYAFFSFIPYETYIKKKYRGL